VECSRCGEYDLHPECAIDFLSEYVTRDNTNSVAITKYKVGPVPALKVDTAGSGIARVWLRRRLWL